MDNKEVDFTLSLKNMNEIPINIYDKNFTFIVNGKKYAVNRFFADLLSPKIRKLHYVDESINEFQISTEDQKYEDHFPDFLNLCLFESKKLDSTLQTEYSNYFLKLGNINEYFKLQPSYSSAITIENAVSLLLKIQEIFDENNDVISIETNTIKEIMSFISEHFDEITRDEKMKINKENLFEILSRENLKVNDEDSLLEFVMYLYENDRSYSNLFSKIIFANVSEKSLEKFINIFSIDDLDSDIWKSICKRLMKADQKSIQSERYLISGKEFKAVEGHEFEGIMRYLTKKTGGNIHDNGTIQISCNSVRSSDFPRNLVDYENDNFYLSNNDEGIFLCFDFKDKKVQLSDYSLKSFNHQKNGTGHLKSWVMEVSNDNENWEEVDRHSDDPTMNEPKKVATFKVSKKLNGFYRFIRLRSTGYCWCPNTYYIYLYFIEFFGKLTES